MRLRASALCLFVMSLSTLAFGQATITIINVNAPSMGFNDPTPAAPVGGNNGTTVGQQRLIAFQFAANIWGAALNSVVELKVNAQFTPLSCTANSGVLGSAGATSSTANFTNAEFTGTWYPITLATARAGSDLAQGGAHISANFNSNVGTPGCLENSVWYYGLDANEPTGQINLVAVVLHELGHGLGFSVGPTSTSSGARASANGNFLPSIWERRMLDDTTAKTWLDMTDAERQASAINTGNLVWTGAQVLAATPNVLSGTPFLQITDPSGIAGIYATGAASFGPPLTGSPLSGQLVVATDAADGFGALTTDACSAIDNGAAVSGKIAVVDRGTCLFTEKAKNVQAAGAIAMIVADNAPGSPPPGLGGADSAVTIPAVRITQADGNTIKGQLAIPVTVSGFLAADLTQLAGADSQGRPKLYTPNPLEQGSSVSHWDTTALPNQLMEPNISADLTHSVKPPQDLTLPLLIDIGWTAASPPVTAAASPGTVAFGDKLIGFGTYSTVVTFTNTGATAVTINSVTLTGSGEFSRTHSCPGSLAASASCAVQVSYTPVSQTQQNATLAIASDATGSPHNISISGRGVTDLALALTRPVRPPRTGLGQGQSLEFDVVLATDEAADHAVTWECATSIITLRCTARATGDGRQAHVVVTNAGRSQRLRTRGTTSAVVRVSAVAGGVKGRLDVPMMVQR